jgi:FtsH-binding integral membrane protein
MMRVSKKLIYANAAALLINAIILWLMAVKMFPPILGIILVVAFLLGSVWLSCKANNMLPPKKQKTTFHSAPTEQVRSY